MMLDLIFSAGNVLGILGLLCGVYLALVAADSLVSLLGKKAGDPTSPVTKRPADNQGFYQESPRWSARSMGNRLRGLKG